MINRIRGFFVALANPVWMFFALPWLMVLLILGTIAQRYLGLYASQKLFFGSFVLWVGEIPLPGAYSTLALISLSLIAKLMLKSILSWRRAGTLLVHVSAIVLLLGGLISALARQEGYMVLGDGDSASIISDYRLRNVTIEEAGKPVFSIPYAKLSNGLAITSPVLPFTLHIVRICFPCGVTAREAFEQSGNLRGIANKLKLISRPYSREDAENISSIEYTLSGAGSEDGSYIALEGLAAQGSIRIGKQHYVIALKPAERALPFSVRLLHFTKSDYPGTDEARAYRSDVEVNDNGLKWKTAIEMNQPLRYKGYTLYQSSFVTEGDRQLSVLAVVKNAGEWFPYLAISMLCAGLLLHILIMLRPRPR